MPSRIRIIEAVTVVLALVSLGAGLWAMLDPHGFYENAARYPPYSRHFIHDIGAFQIGLGGCLVAGVLVRDALLVVLAGNTLGAVAHFAGHVADSNIGGGANDPVIFGVLALVFAALTMAHWMRRAEAGHSTTVSRARGRP
jgi:hypothetical protein